MRTTQRNPAGEKRSLLALAVIAAAALAIFWRVGGYPFIFFDDNLYVTENPRVLGGLTWRGLAWAWGSFHAANWHPLTWMSHMADVALFGARPGAHHLTSLLLHLLNALLLFAALRRMTGVFWPAVYAALLFALHPLHVESVAWVAERKDVLSACFWLLTLIAYLRYAAQPGLRRYLPVAASLALGLTAKPMLVTLPFALLLLDYWPLGRFVAPRGEHAPPTPWHAGRPPLRLLLEKAPLLALAAVSSAITLYAQNRGGALKSLEDYPFPARAGNALLTYLQYLRKAVWPLDLAVIYPHPGGGLQAWQVAGAAGALLAATAAALLLRRRLPYLAVGWLWYLGTLVPVIGLVQVGLQAMADRYAYIPLIGIFVALSWALAALCARSPALRRVTITPALAALLLLAAACWREVGHWQDGVTLFRRALAVTANNYQAHNQLGIALAAESRPREAEAEFRRAIAIKRDYVDPYYNLGLLFDSTGGEEAAREFYLAALRIDPDYAAALNNLGVLAFNQGRLEEALACYRRAAALDPENDTAKTNLELALKFIAKKRAEP